MVVCDFTLRFVDRKMRWKIDDLLIFRLIVEMGSMTKAADELGVPKSTVSRALQRLEQDMGLRLLERNPRTNHVTAEGQLFYGYACNIHEHAALADAQISGLRSVPSGRLRLAAPAAFCREYLIANISTFTNKYPAVKLEITVTSGPVDVMGGVVDMAIVVGDQQDSSLRRRVLLSDGLIWVCSPTYRGETAGGFDETSYAEHLKVGESRYAGRELTVRLGRRIVKLAVPAAVLQINDPLCVRDAIIQGMGVGLLPRRYCQDQLRNGSLIEVWNDVVVDERASSLSVVYPSRDFLTPRSKAMLDFLQQICTTPSSYSDFE